MGGLIAFLTGLPGMLSGMFGTINHVTDALTNAKIAQMNATTDQEKIAATERVNTLTLRRDVMIAEAATTKLNVYMRFALAGCVLIILAKIFVWDKSVGPFFGCVGKYADAAKIAACQMFVTDPLDDNLWHVVMVVVGFYFLSEAATFFRRK